MNESEEASNAVRKSAPGTVMAIIQSINIALYALVVWISYFQGKAILLFYAFSLFPIQAILFVYLFAGQLIRFFHGFRKHEFQKRDYITHAYPIITFVSLSIFSWVADTMKWNDPFSNDAFRIEAEFHEDGTCDIYFDGVKRSDSAMKYEYTWGCGYGIGLSCSSHPLGHSSGNHFMITFSTLPHRTSLPLRESITDLGKGDAFKEFGAAYFDDQLSRKYSTGNGVYWDFYSGSAVIEKAFTPHASEASFCGAISNSIFVGKFSGLAKRKFRGP